MPKAMRELRSILQALAHAQAEGLGSAGKVQAVYRRQGQLCGFVEGLAADVASSINTTRRISAPGKSHRHWPKRMSYTALEA